MGSTSLQAVPLVFNNTRNTHVMAEGTCDGGGLTAPWLSKRMLMSIRAQEHPSQEIRNRDKSKPCSLFKEVVLCLKS